MAQVIVQNRDVNQVETSSASDESSVLVFVRITSSSSVFANGFKNPRGGV